MTEKQAVELISAIHLLSFAISLGVLALVMAISIHK